MITASSHLTDHLLNSLYPSSTQVLAKHHWTPLPVAQEAAGHAYTTWGFATSVQLRQEDWSLFAI
jgi:hypothetical protein